MKKIYLLFLIPFLLGATIANPPKDDALSVQTQQYLKEIYENLNRGNFKVGVFTRDMTAASGTQSVTGVGFTPKAIFVVGCVGAKSIMSIGISDATTGKSVFDYHGTVADTWGSDDALISLWEDNTKYQSAVLASFDADGFTLTWTKVGSPTAGTANLFYLVFE